MVGHIQHTWELTHFCKQSSFHCSFNEILDRGFLWSPSMVDDHLMQKNLLMDLFTCNHYRKLLLYLCIVPIYLVQSISNKLTPFTCLYMRHASNPCWPASTWIAVLMADSSVSNQLLWYRLPNLLQSRTYSGCGIWTKDKLGGSYFSYVIFYS